MATIARFRGGRMDGQEMPLPEDMPTQSFIVVDTAPPAVDWRSPDPHPTTSRADRETYERRGVGYTGEDTIVIYRLEEKRGRGN